jgi:hypothetical protein
LGKIRIIAIIRVKMILLKPNIVNKVALTLWERAIIIAPYYLFTLTSKQSKEVVSFIGVDSTTHVYRYNLFLIEVKNNPNLLNNEVNLTLGDEYDYVIREQSSSTNLNTALAGGIVEVGILTYNNQYATRTEYERGYTPRAVYQR